MTEDDARKEAQLLCNRFVAEIEAHGTEYRTVISALGTVLAHYALTAGIREEELAGPNWMGQFYNGARLDFAAQIERGKARPLAALKVTAKKPTDLSGLFDIWEGKKT